MSKEKTIYEGGLSFSLDDCNHQLNNNHSLLNYKSDLSFVVRRIDRIRIYVNGEKCKHNLPHAHVHLSNGNNYSVCIYKEPYLLEGTNDRYIRRIIKDYFDSKTIQKCREAWEECCPDATCHFNYDEDSKTYK